MTGDPMSPWSRMDRKASAVAEFTIRQYLARSSTWVVLGLAAGMMFVLLMFYASEMRSAVDPIDNDGDADDADGDGYVNGHEILAGTNPFDPSVFPDGDPMPASAFIDEDDYDWSAIGTGFASGDAAVSVSVGVDDDGDCWRNASATPPTNSSRDGSNQNGIPCDVLIEWSQFSQVAIVTGDTGVDEDPDDQRYYRESLHRAFIVGTGKVGFVFLLSVFIPLFLAAGLIREDMESGTIHYILSKPMGRGSIILARLLGYLGLTWPALAAIIGVMALVTTSIGPGDGIRGSDLIVWGGILIAAWLCSLAYAALFTALGVLWRYGVLLGLVFAVWEFAMAITSLAAPNAGILLVSISGHGSMLIDAVVAVAWPETDVLILQGQWAGTSAVSGFRSTAPPGAEVLDAFTNAPSLGLPPLASASVNVAALATITALFWFVSRALFQGKEVE